MGGTRQRTQQPPMAMEQFTMQIRQELTTRGYDPGQIRTIMGLAERMSRGQNVGVNQSWLDINDLNRVAHALTNGRANPRQREELLRNIGIRGPPARIRLREIPVRTPERTYAYRVSMGGQTFEVVSRTEVPSGGSGSGPAHLARSRRGLLRQALIQGPARSGLTIYAVTSSGERGRQLNATQFRDFTAAYLARYNRMERALISGQEMPELITVASVRRRPSGG